MSISFPIPNRCQDTDSPTHISGSGKFPKRNPLRAANTNTPVEDTPLQTWSGPKPWQHTHQQGCTVSMGHCYNVFLQQSPTWKSHYSWYENQWLGTQPQMGHLHQPCPEKSQETLWRGGWKELKSGRIGKAAVECWLLHVVWLLPSWPYGICGYLDKMKPVKNPSREKGGTQECMRYNWQLVGAEERKVTFLWKYSHW